MTFYPLTKFIASARVAHIDIGFPASLGLGSVPISKAVKLRPRAVRVAGLLTVLMLALIF